MLHIRSAQWPDDIPAVVTLDTSFVTGTVYRVVPEDLSFRLVEEAVTPPLHKRYPFDPSDPAERADWDCAVVAEDEGRVVGFAAAQYVAWNRRVVLWHLYVAPDARGSGVGTQLLVSVEDFARSAGAWCLWLETQSVNVPAVRFYQRQGFTLCGLDTRLYDPQGDAGDEVALFFAKEPTP